MGQQSKTMKNSCLLIRPFVKCKDPYQLLKKKKKKNIGHCVNLVRPWSQASCQIQPISADSLRSIQLASSLRASYLSGFSPPTFAASSAGHFTTHLLPHMLPDFASYCSLHRAPLLFLPKAFYARARKGREVCAPCQGFPHIYIQMEGQGDLEQSHTA